MKDILLGAALLVIVQLGIVKWLYQPAPKVVEIERTYYSCAPSYETRIPDVYEFTLLRGDR